MEPVFRSDNPSVGIATRVVHGRRLKRAFNWTMDWVGELSPEFSYALRTSLREAAFPLRPDKSDTSPKLRDDVPIYAALYRHATANFERIVSRYQNEIRWPKARVYNGFFETIDAELYYCTIRSFRPSRIVEVGAGNSTWFARDALRANGSGELCAIDPSPRLRLPKECRHLQRLVEEVDITLFEELRENDILFVDSSHSEQEAHYLVDRIYPVLHPGVLIHHHDIVFPYLGYASFVPDWEHLGEQAVILDFLLANQGSYEVLTSSAYVHYEEPDLVLRLIPSKSARPLIAGGSTWIRKRA